MSYSSRPRNPPPKKAYKRQETADATTAPPALADVQSVIDKFRVVDQLKQASDGSLAISLLPNDKLHLKDETVAFEIGRQKYPNLTLINLAVDGTINLLYPALKNDTVNIPIDKPYKLADIKVEAPFGADHLLAILSETPLLALHDSLKKNDKTHAAEFLTLLNKALQGNRYQLAIHASFTADSSSK